MLIAICCFVLSQWLSLPSSPLLMSPKTNADKVYADGVEITVFAQRAPQPKPSGDEGVDAQRKLQRLAFMKVVSLLQQHEDLIYPQLASLQASIHRKTHAGPIATMFPGTYCKVKYLPKYWMAAFLRQACGFPKALLDNIDHSDSDTGIKHTFEFICQVDGFDSIPASMLDKVERCHVFCVRTALVCRVKGWMSQHVKADGRINWAAAGAYIVEWEGERAVGVMHRGSNDKARVPPHTVDKTWTLENNVNDLRTVLKKDGTEHLLHKLFVGATGPHKQAITKTNTLKMLHDNVKAKVHAPAYAIAFEADCMNSDDRNAILKKADSDKKDNLKKAAATKAATTKRRKIVQLDA
jgi:hypothetical protein